MPSAKTAAELEKIPMMTFPPAKTILANIEIAAIFSFTPLEVCLYIVNSKLLISDRFSFLVISPLLQSRKIFNKNFSDQDF